MTEAGRYHKAAQLIHDALDAASERMVYHDRRTGTVDGESTLIAAALLDAGWLPPDRSG